ncbi:hypothetical protein ACLMJK_008836 [Lecanora helva]
MNDDPLAVSKPEEAETAATVPGPEVQPDAAEARSNPKASPTSSTTGQTNGINFDKNYAEAVGDKSDSEAETVVLSGNQEGKNHELKKSIKLEEVNGTDSDVIHPLNHAKVNDKVTREASTETEVRKPSLKRKRVTLDHGSGEDPEGANSSNLSSTISSPIQEPRSSKATDTASNRSRSSPPSDEATQGQERRPHKAKTGDHSVRNHNHESGKNDRASGSVVGRRRRDTRSATHYDELTHRSESPPLRNNYRAQSIQSNPPHSGVTKRKRAPAPLHVERRRKASEDTHLESEDDSSVHSHHHLQRLTSTDNNAMSPAKMVSSKKNRDRNGRTLLARACQSGDVGEVEKWLKERPQDINVPDNAGNTPLQIAALDGLIDVVRLLLDAGCDTDCKNIDKDTPLIDAVENGHLELVELLLKVGLDPRQTNAFGKEPLDLVNPDDEHADELREVLQASKKEKASLRRPSEDYNRQHSAGFRDAGTSAPGASPVHSTRSPPPVGLGARRRTARSQQTDDALLWVNATPARLRDAAGKGDLTIVDHILKMRPQADTESILAAARGGHDDVLNLMLAIATPDPDPEPLRSGDYKPAYSTPMLAAIGRGNANTINLLLAQPGFDPTRRLYKNMTYYELAKERQGSDWQEEYDILKEAYDNYKQNGGRKSNHNSPRKVRSKRADSSKSGSEPSSSPFEARKIRKPSTLKEEASNGIKDDSTQKVRNGAEDKKQGSPAVPSDMELDPQGPPKHKTKGEQANDGKENSRSKHAESLKPKRRLMSGHDLKSDQDVKRRASLAAEADLLERRSDSTALNRDVRQRRFSDASESKTKPIPTASLNADGVSSKKRHRMSVSPQARKTDIGSTAEVKHKKRQRVDSQGNAIDQDRERSFRAEAPAMVANMVTSPTSSTSPAISQGTAPVAFMGTNVTSPMNKSPTDLRPNSSLVSPVNSIDQALALPPDQGDLQTHRNGDLEKASRDEANQEADGKTGIHEEVMPRQNQVDQEKLAQAERQDAERKAREAREKARLEEQRRSAEAERQDRIQKEFEEDRQAKIRREEDVLRRRIEQERIRKEEQERRRREAEERENQRRMRLQEEEETQRLYALPNGLRRAAQLSPEEARNGKEITKWLPLRTVTTQELDPGCEPHVAEERWVANLQAAPILAVRDLDLSQYTAWTRFPATPNHRGSLWRQLRNVMSQAIPTALTTPTQAFHLDEETRPKFFSLPHVFWIKFSDFMDIVPRHQHLAGLQIKTRAMVLHEFPFGRGGSWDRPAVDGAVKQEVHSPMMNGNLTNGFR